MHLSTITLHPVKSTARREVAQAEVTVRGLRGDREWMLVDADGAMVSARELPGLFGIRAQTPWTEPDLAADLVLTSPGRDDLTIARPDGEPAAVTMFGYPLQGVPVPGASAWLREVTGTDLRLIWCDDPSRRVLDVRQAQGGGPAAYQDAGPVSLVSSASVGQLNEWVRQTAAERGEPVPAPLPAGRFRPNLVVDEASEPFAEDGWSRVQIGEVAFGVAHSISRCVMTTIDAETHAKGKEPIRTMARHRRWDGKTWMCQHLVPEGEGRISVGDAVTVLD